MPPKSVECSVCHQEVPKSQTLEVSPGIRACRSHEGTLTAAEQKQRSAKEAERQREQKRSKWHTAADPEAVLKLQQEMNEFRLWTETHCWTCGTQGISLREYFFALLIVNKRLELQGKFSLLMPPAELRQELGNPTVLTMLPYNHQTDRRILRLVVKDRLKQVVPFLQAVRLCGGCIEKFQVQDRLEALLPKPTWEQLENMLPVVAMLDPVLTQLATERGEN